MATMMTANVAMIIMPNQRKSIARLVAGEQPDPKWGKEAKQRSTHNNYITLPVLFMMLSNHYPALYANSRTIPLLVVCVIVAGALIRYFYNNYHADHSARAVVGVARGGGGVVGRLLDRDLWLAGRAAGARHGPAGDQSRGGG